MTSKVTVTCHGYPVLVEQLSVSNNNPNGEWKATQSVQPGQALDFTLHSGVQFKITELPAFGSGDPALTSNP